jgi:hypothetical protein
MGKKAYTGYDMYWVGDITRREESCILIWEADGSTLSSFEELKDSSEQILKNCLEASDNFYHWLDFDIPIEGR